MTLLKPDEISNGKWLNTQLQMLNYSQEQSNTQIENVIDKEIHNYHLEIIS